RFVGARLIGVTMDKKRIYRTTIRAAATVSLNINSEPSGAIVFLDNHKVGVTPITIPDTPMGKHTISLTSPDSKIADNLVSDVIDISASSANFDFNLMKKRSVTFQAQPSKAEITIEKAGKTIGKGSGTFTLDNLEYGTYKILGYLNGERSESIMEINEKTSTPTIIKVIPSRSISFTAIQNNGQVRDADINLNGEYIGKTPLTKSIEFGSYYVDMTYRGYHKHGKLKVDKNSNGRYELVLPNRLKGRHNPFNIDYPIREWGIAANYINRCYNFKVIGQNSAYNFWGDEGHENGAQLGLIYQPYFGYGQGLSTGIYWQFFMGEVEGLDAKYQEHSIFVPLQYQFRFPISRNFSLFVNAGAAFNWGVEHTLKFDDSDDNLNLGYGTNEDYDCYFPKAINFSLIYGGGIQIGPIQIEAKFQRGLTDNDDMYTADEDEKVSCKLKTWSVGLSFMF
ncbi:MAG: PEGA domain-containing protein, partial [Muribaculaceae bacterium]|nr:PEGA domain-containing protein [Muribaculaceae bacterium]